MRRETADIHVEIRDLPGRYRIAVVVPAIALPLRRERFVITSATGKTVQALVDFTTPALDGVCEGTIIAAFADQRATLAGFVTGLMASTPDDERLRQKGPGWFLWVGDVEPAKHVSANSGRRAEPRVPVRVPLTWSHAGESANGRAFNVSQRGLFLLAPENGQGVPACGEEIEVRYPIAHHIRTVDVLLKGHVRWCEKIEGKEVYGIGVQIEAFLAPEQAQVWSTYVQHEAEFQTAPA